MTGFQRVLVGLLKEKTQELFEAAVLGDVEGWRPIGMLAALDRGEEAVGARLRALAEAEALPAPRIRYGPSAAEQFRHRPPEWVLMSETYPVDPDCVPDMSETDWLAIIRHYSRWTW